MTTNRVAGPPASRTTSRRTVIRPTLSSAPPIGITTPTSGNPGRSGPLRYASDMGSAMGER